MVGLLFCGKGPGDNDADDSEASDDDEEGQDDASVQRLTSLLRKCRGISRRMERIDFQKVRAFVFVFRSLLVARG